MGKNNVSGRKTRPNPPSGNPTAGSSTGTTSKKRSRSSGPGLKTGFTPDEKSQNQGNLEINSPLGAQASAAASISSATAGGSPTKEASSSLAPILGTGNGNDNSEVTKFSSQEINSLLASSPNHPSGNPNSVLTDQIMQSPRSVSELAMDSKCRIVDPLESGDEELGDLTKEEIEDIEKKQLETGENVGDNEEPKAKKPTWASVAKPKVKCFEVLYIHHGEEERLPILKEQFYKLYDRINTAVLEQILQGVEVHNNVVWRSWSKGRGLVATADKETSDFICNLVKNTKIQKTCFRAWHSSEFGRGKLVTGHLEGNATKSFSHENIMKIIMINNKLKGSYTGVKFTDTDRGRLLQFFASKELWDDLLARREVQGTSKVRLKMGISPILFTLSKPKKAAEEAQGSADAASSAPASSAESEATSASSNQG